MRDRQIHTYIKLETELLAQEAVYFWCVNLMQIEPYKQDGNVTYCLNQDTSESESINNYIKQGYPKQSIAPVHNSSRIPP